MKKRVFIINSKTLFIAIAVLAFTLRFYKLGQIPLSLSWDEVSLGYNAYSILKTGRDEHGKRFPVAYFEAYGDYKPPLYIYLTVPFVALFGLNEFSVRLPSAFAGTLTVVGVYYLVLKLFGSKRQSLALLSSFFLAISPWHLNLSRAGFEANVALGLVTFAILFMLKAIRGIKKYYLISVVFFVLSLYTFNSARIFIPFFVLFLTLYFRKEFWRDKKWVFVSLIIALILCLPFISHLLSKEGRLRFQEVNIFSDITPIETANKRIEVDKNTWWAPIVHNRRISFAIEMARHYFDNFNMNFLFINGDGNPKFSIRDVGQLYLWDLPFLILGIYYLLRNKEGKWLFVPVWLLLSIVPASVARETPHALRILNGLPAWQILIAYGYLSAMPPFIKRRKSYLIHGAVLMMLLGNVIFYLYNYHVFYPTEFASEWQWGYREGIAQIRQMGQNYDQIRISDAIGRPYMYVLFYTKYDPVAFWKEVDRTSDPYGFFNVHGFGKYLFGSYRKLETGKKTLYLGAPKEIPGNANIISTINYPNGKPALMIYE